MCPEAEGVVAPIGAVREPCGDWNADWQRALHELNWQMAVFALPTTRSDVGPVSLTEGLVSGELEAQHGRRAGPLGIRWISVSDGAVLVAIEENEVLTGENLLSDEQVVEIVEKACARSRLASPNRERE